MSCPLQGKGPIPKVIEEAHKKTGRKYVIIEVGSEGE